MGQTGGILGNVILVTADIVALYPNIPHKAGMKVLTNYLEKREQEHIPTEKIINMAEIVLKNNFFELMILLNNKFQEWPLVQGVLPLTPVYIYILTNPSNREKYKNHFLKIRRNALQ